MNIVRKKSIIGLFLFSLTLFASCNSFAWHGGYRGGWHGSYYSGWHGGPVGWGWRGANWVGAGIVGTGLMLGAPFFYNNYRCGYVRVCDAYGCGLARNCY